MSTTPTLSADSIARERARANADPIALGESGLHALVMQRLALFAGVGCVLSIAVHLFMNVDAMVRAGGSFTKYADFAFSPMNFARGGVTVVLGVIWLLCAKSRMGARWLGIADAATVLSMSLMGAVRAFEAPAGPLPDFQAIMSTMVMLMGRSAVVPSTVKRTLLIGVLGVAMVAAATFAGNALGGSVVTALRPTMFVIAWGGLTVVVAGIATRTIFRLGEQVRLGQYVLEEKVGEGGMGVVYRASHAMLRRPTAIKLLPPDKSEVRNVERFEREVRLTCKLTHPNTITIFDFGRTHDGMFYYAMEYLEGLDLDKFVRVYDVMPEARAIYVLRQICASLAEAHEMGFVHRDIKLANIFLCKQGGEHDFVKVLDFGLVRNVHVQSNVASLSEANMLVGTPQYMSPEAIMTPSQVDARSDIYAVGVVAYRLLTGQHVFTGDSLTETCIHHISSQPMPPSFRLHTPISQDLENVILSCLEKDPNRRPQSARALFRMLEGCKDARDWSSDKANAWWATHNEHKRTQPRPPPTPLHQPYADSTPTVVG